MQVDAPRIIAEAVDYDTLIAGLRERKAALGLTDNTVDDLAGFNSGYTGKLLGGCQVKKLGPMSLGAMLKTLTVKLALIEDLEAAAQIGKRYEKRKYIAVMPKRMSIKAIVKRFSPEIADEMARRGHRKSRYSRLTKEQRANQARHAALMRWRRVRWRRAQQRSRAARRLHMNGVGLHMNGAE